jgi:hypothetical protein
MNVRHGYCERLKICRGLSAALNLILESSQYEVKGEAIFVGNAADWCEGPQASLVILRAVDRRPSLAWWGLLEMGLLRMG